MAKKQEETVFYSIRVVKAKNYKEAIKKVQNAEFDETHELCDAVLSPIKTLIAIKEQGL